METITTSIVEQRRALTLTRVAAGELAPADVAASLGCPERHLARPPQIP
jgi:hypothetical protein